MQQPHSNFEPLPYRELSLLERAFLTILTVIGALIASLIVITPLSLREQCIFGVLTFLVAWLLNRRRGRFITLMLIALSITVSSRYVYWRTTTTLDLESTSDLVFGMLLLFAELFSYLVLILGYVQLAWPIRRSPIPLNSDASTWPTVDVYIPTYNEALSVVRATILAAKAMDWPEAKLRVYVLDDGRRNEFRDFAQRAGVGYIIRSDNAHAKAGNINNALKQTSGEFVAIFDCDHVPTRSFLQMTMGWLVRDPDMAFVQTPHHFNSPDPFERNLNTFRAVPNEGELFYGVIQPGNDTWNAAYFCGSCAVIRREAFDEVGGMAVDSVTEDAHTSLRMHRRGWKTAYIPLIQASGLATDSLGAHVGQRIRWARGMVQIFRIDNPFLGRGLTMWQRLCYFSAMVHFLHGIPRIIMLSAPLAFLMGGANILNASAFMVLAFAMPHLIHSTMTSSRIHGPFRYSFWSEVYETVLATYIILPTTLALINPKLGKFNVTAKGGLIEHSYFDRKLARPYIFLLLINLVGLGFGIWRLWVHHNPPEVVWLNIAWTLYNCVVIGAAIAVAREGQQRRSASRISTTLPAMLRTAVGYGIRCKTLDLSVGGGMLEMPPMAPLPKDEKVTVSVFCAGVEMPLPARVVSHRGNKIQLRFDDLTIEQETWMVQAVYSRANAWHHWTDGRAVDRPLQSGFGILRHSANGLRVLTAKSGEVGD